MSEPPASRPPLSLLRPPRQRAFHLSTSLRRATEPASFTFSPALRSALPLPDADSSL